ncbi:MAG: 2-methylfumaryl-CoA isomerase [Solirubrobacteraceae bacterium]|jgi:2-methylfumaryl-CoA isomerase|nr:2-methylfumaryl-CoA isomerase [Solirubrobacteraceae bacterium]
MSEGILSGVRVIEGSAFVAAPTAGMTLAQLGADVIRFDAPGGGLDFKRWPLDSAGNSLFWSGLNKGKRSIEVDLRSDEGRETLTRLITAPGPGNGIFLTNFPARGWMSYEALSARRPDLVMVVMSGNHDGSSEVDYTVNPSAGFPEAMGPRDSAVPTNSLMPAWDSIMGGLAVVGLLAALRHRDATGEGQRVKIALSDVAFATVGNLGRIAEVQLEGREQPRDGNYLYGAFGGDFPTKDGRRVMVVALTSRQWKALKEATGTEELFATVEHATGHDFRGEAGRYKGRDLIRELLTPWFGERTLEEIRASFAGTGVSWGPYQTFKQLVEEDARCSTENPMFTQVEHPVGTYLTPASPLEFGIHGRTPAVRSPELGEHTDEIMAQLEADADADATQDPATAAGPTPAAT